MTIIKQEDLITSIADALQFISYYHPVDFIRAMREAYEREESPAAKAALTQVLVNLTSNAMPNALPILQADRLIIALASVPVIPIQIFMRIF